MATVAVAALIRREKQIIEAMRAAGAVTPDTAVTMQAIGMHERLAFRKLRNRGVLREAAPDYFYLDDQRWESLTRLRHTIAGVMIVIALAVIVYVLFIPNFRR
jgi:hypothetical protein